MRLGRSAVVISAALGAMSAMLVAGGTASADPAACKSLEVIAIPGTWETGPGNTPVGNGLLGAVTDGMASARVGVSYVSYVATAFPWESQVYGASKAEGIAHADGMMGAIAAECPSSKFAIIGYSQGADVAGDLAARIGHGQGAVGADRVVGVGLLSDPRRSEYDHLVGPPVPGNGGGGPRLEGFGALTEKIRTFCAPGDLYCAAPQEDFVARIFGFAAQQSDPGSSDKQAVPEGQNLLNELMAAGGIQLLQGQLTEGNNEARYRQIDGFLKSGAHQDYTRYVVDAQGNSATQWLRGWLIGLA
ncbi:cutinase family protein [Tomitella biformata]|uniref:cutinase family protein n=1 Tax=Tomitella biformata TaxID=630403 RepID=UPI0004664B35|nr:cutinase family protein [Tomitella biformata]